MFGFLTTTPNAEVEEIHPKAMPVILLTQDEVDAWLTLPWSEAEAMQKPLPSGSLTIAADAPTEPNQKDVTVGYPT